MFTRAIARLPGENFAEGITTSKLGAPDFNLALQQHQAYQRALVACGLELHILPADLHHPDSTFVEDTAVLIKDLAIITRPGVPSRLGEIENIEKELRNFFSRLEHITPPGTLDGGDICEAGSHFFIGISERTNEAGAKQLSQILNREGFSSEFIDVRGIPGLLHLKSGIAYIGGSTLVVANAIAQRASFRGYKIIPVEDREQYAANCIWVNNQILLPKGFPNIQLRLERESYKIILLEMSEFEKMDGGLSCISLRFS